VPTWWTDFWSREPALQAWLGNGGLALLAAYVFHWDSTRQAAAATAVTAVAALYSAWRARPAHIQVASGALSALMAAGVTFGLHIAPDAKALVLAAGSSVLGLLWRAHLSPVPVVHEKAPEHAMTP
jgi:hypothetical protein